MPRTRLRSGYGYASGSVLENASAVEVVHEPGSAGGGDGGTGFGNGVAFENGYAFEVDNVQRRKLRKDIFIYELLQVVRTAQKSPLW